MSQMTAIIICFFSTGIGHPISVNWYNLDMDLVLGTVTTKLVLAGLHVLQIEHSLKRPWNYMGRISFVHVQWDY